MKEYKFLKIARTAFKVLAWLALFIYTLVALFALLSIIAIFFIDDASLPPGILMPSPAVAIAGLISAVAMGSLYFFVLSALSEVIKQVVYIREKIDTLSPNN